jgi:cytochrome P450
MTAEEPGTGRVMPDELIVDNLVTYLLAGPDSTAKALRWTLYLLALLPEWHVRAFKLLDALLLESLRFYPPAPSLMRRARKPTCLGGVALRGRRRS